MANYTSFSGPGTAMTSVNAAAAIREFWGPAAHNTLTINLAQSLPPTKLVINVEIFRPLGAPINARITSTFEIIPNVSIFRQSKNATDLGNRDLRTIIMFDQTDPVFYFILDRQAANNLSVNNIFEVDLGFANAKICLIIIKRRSNNPAAGAPVLLAAAEAGQTIASGGVKLP